MAYRGKSKEDLVNAEVEVAVENTTSAEATESKSKKKKRVFRKDELIPCTSIIGGELAWIGSRTGNLYRWFGSGETIDVEYQDLLSAILSRTNSVIYSPMIFIEDEELVNEHKAVRNVYDSMYSPRDLKKVLDLPIDEMVATIKSMPSGAQDTMKVVAATCIQTGRLDSIRKITALDNILGTKLVIESEIFN